jgi:hypothetical protein
MEAYTKCFNTALASEEFPSNEVQHEAELISRTAWFLPLRSLLYISDFLLGIYDNRPYG